MCWTRSWAKLICREAMGANMLSDKQMIIEAIRTRSEIEFFYGAFRRVYWPYIIGETKKGELEMFGWQRLSGKRGSADFRQFQLSDLSGLVSTGHSFAQPLLPVDPVKRGFVRVFARL